MDEYDNWVVWKLQRRGDKQTKVPYDAKTGAQAATTNSAQWSPLAEAMDAVRTGQYTGVGFAFGKADPFIGVDIDHCVNESTLEISPWARRIVDALNSYTEYSPSRTGLHVFVRAEQFTGKNQVNCIPGAKVEMYCDGRYFTFTGMHVPGAPTSVEERSEEFAAVRGELLEDARRVESGKALQNGAKFWQLWQGEWEDEYGSQSEADLALASNLVYLARGDGEVADRLFRYSGLWREKWDELRGEMTYGQRTIDTALKGYDARQDQVLTTSADYTEWGNAIRVVQKHGENLLFDWDDGRWYQWNNAQWKESKHNPVFTMIQQVVKEIEDAIPGEPDRNKRALMADHVIRSRIYSKAKGAEMFTRYELPTTKSSFDSNLMLFNVANGTLDLNTGELYPHVRTDMITKIAMVHYDPAARAPRWKNFIETVLCGDKSLIEFVQRAVGYTLTGSTREQCLFFLYGMGANGKSTFLNVLRTVLGDYATTADSSTFMLQKDDRPRNDVARLVGRRFVVSTEVEEGRKLAEVLVKQLTGGDVITARFLHKEFFEFTPQFKLWMAGNHRPEIYGDDHAIWRRMRLVPFTYTVTDSERDQDLGMKLMSESSGILNWMLEGLSQWKSRGLGSAEAVDEATRSYRTDMDVLAGFLDECVERYTAETVKVMTMTNCYKQWCVLNREKELPKAQFILRMKGKGYMTQSGTGNVRYWKGVRLTEEGQRVVKMSEFGYSGDPSPGSAVEYADLYSGGDGGRGA